MLYHFCFECLIVFLLFMLLCFKIIVLYVKFYGLSSSLYLVYSTHRKLWSRFEKERTTTQTVKLYGLNAPKYG